MISLLPIAAALIVILFGSLIVIRKRQYKYNPRQNYHYDLGEGKKLDVSLPLDLSEYSANTTLILSLTLKSKLLGHFFQPYVEIIGEGSEKTYLEHALSGKRYLDMSGFAAKPDIRLSFHHCAPLRTDAALHAFESPDIADKKVLVLASHPDDAEIAAYGVYSSAKEGYIVTITPGEGKCGYCALMGNKQEQAIQKGRLRVHDALTVASLGGVPQHRSVMLGYFCKTLKWMKTHPAETAVSGSTGVRDIGFFRRVDHAGFKCNEDPSATWDSLVEDMKRILDSVQPDLIVTPHPQIDSHSDHQYTTYALLEAMEKCGCKQIPLLTYTNHLLYNEAYPYGPMFSTSALAPRLKKPFECSGVYAHRLSSAQQYDKFYALEGMHDLRNALSPIGVKRAWKHFIKQLMREVQQRDKSYYRRSVRPNELFYVADWEELNKFSS